MAKKLDYASLYTLRPDGRYQGYWRDADGKRHALCDRDPARLYARLQERAAELEEHPITFADVAEKWKDIRFGQLAYKSVEAYKPVFRRVTARFGAEVLGHIQTRDVSAWLQTLATEGYKKRTVQMHRDMMSQIYNFAIGEGLTRENPVDHAVMPRGLASGTRGIADDKALDAVRRGVYEPFGLFALVCLYAGLRRGEALALCHEDVDRAAGVIHVTKAVEFIGNSPRLKEPKTASGRRDVILPRVLSDAIPDGSGYLFPNEKGELLSRSGFQKRWDRYCKAIGYEITAHQLRHGYATMLYEAEIGDRDAQEQLGHASIELTRNVYTHIRATQRSRAAAKLNRYLEAEPEDEQDVVHEILDLLEGRDAPAILAQVAAALAADQNRF